MCYDSVAAASRMSFGSVAAASTWPWRAGLLQRVYGCRLVASLLRYCMYALAFDGTYLFPKGNITAVSMSLTMCFIFDTDVVAGIYR